MLGHPEHGKILSKDICITEGIRKWRDSFLKVFILTALQDILTFVWKAYLSTIESFVFLRRNMRRSLVVFGEFFTLMMQDNLHYIHYVIVLWVNLYSSSKAVLLQRMMIKDDVLALQHSVICTCLLYVSLGYFQASGSKHTDANNQFLSEISIFWIFLLNRKSTL